MTIDPTDARIPVETLPKPPGDSGEQRDAEAVMVAALAERCGVPLAPRRILLPNGGRVEIDAASEDLSILCEAWAHQGPPKSAQKNKVLTDALKLVFVSRVLGTDPRLILLLSDPLAAAPFRGASWSAEALRTFDVTIEIAPLPEDVRLRIVDAQVRQFR